MTRTISQSPLTSDYGATLNRILELAMQTAEAASAEGNHKVVIQAVREVTPDRRPDPENGRPPGPGRPPRPRPARCGPRP